MILIIGGAYQGKLEYAMKKYNLKENEVFNCKGMDIDLSKKVINDFENFIWFCSENKKEPLDVMENELLQLQKSGKSCSICDKIFICNDISQGVVPVESNVRNYRELSGRTLTKLASDADEVIRVFCGLECKIK